MPISNEEPLPPAGEAAPTPASTPVDSLSEVNDQLESVKLSEPNAPADATVRDTNPKEDPELWKPHPPSEECPVCMVPLPFFTKQRYWVCCGKLLCTACCEEHGRALRVTNRKREKKKQQPLEKTCAFCRRPHAKNNTDLIRRYEERIEKDDTRAMANFALTYKDGKNGLKKNNAKGVELLNRAAGLGSAEAIGQLGTWAAYGWLESIPDTTSAKDYLEDATKRGDVYSRFNLAKLLVTEGNYDFAIKHWHLAAAAGDEQSMKCLWKCLSIGKISKPYLEKALRSHKAASDEMNSEERERCDAFKKALAGNDARLTIIYQSYYSGYLNAKELKVALKAYRAGDWRAVGILLTSKGMN